MNLGSANQFHWPTSRLIDTGSELFEMDFFDKPDYGKIKAMLDREKPVDLSYFSKRRYTEYVDKYPGYTYCGSQNYCACGNVGWWKEEKYMWPGDVRGQAIGYMCRICGIMVDSLDNLQDVFDNPVKIVEKGGTL